VTVTGVDAGGLGLTGSDVRQRYRCGHRFGIGPDRHQHLGSVQGAVGAGENLLNYATVARQLPDHELDGSEASIKDANVAADASNLAQEQTLQQSSIAALAQANSMPEAVLKLLQ
jgi:flagellin